MIGFMCWNFLLYYYYTIKGGEIKMWEYVIGGATIFALIVGLFSVYNGRATRRLIVEEMKRTEELIREEVGSTQKILEKLSEQHTTMINILKASQT